MVVSREELITHLRIEQYSENEYLEKLLSYAEGAAMDFCMVPAFEEEPAPEPVRLAVLLFASHLYVNRENNEREAWEAMLDAFHKLLWPYRRLVF